MLFILCIRVRTAPCSRQDPSEREFFIVVHHCLAAYFAEHGSGNAHAKQAYFTPTPAAWSVCAFCWSFSITSPTL